jgi:menaquinone-dependent protoporphyrinogen oxidase
MDTLVLYSSKYGGTEKIAEILVEEMSREADLINLSRQKEIHLLDYSNIFIGTPIYKGKARKDVMDFCQKNLDILLKKNLGIFISCWFEDKFDKYIQDSFPPALVKQAKIVHAGIEADPSAMSILDRFIVKTVAKMKKPVSNIKRENMKELIESVIKR